MIKKILKPLVPQNILNLYRQRQVISEWKNKGCPVPPPHLIKQNAIQEYQRKYQYEILVETGTFMGDMVEAQKRNFKKVYSIELGIDIFKRAQQRFKEDKNVIIIQGNSGKVLPDIILKLNEPAIFWLDGHYSAGITSRGDKDCPILEELDAIFIKKCFEHILLIDDARCFTGNGDYPTIEELTRYLKTKNGRYRVEVKHDIIRCVI